MQYRRLGHSGLKVSAVSLGSWLTLGNTVDQATTQRLVAAARELGINLLDTADVYARGEGEAALGRAIAGLRREHLVLASKCHFPMSDDINDRGLSRKHVFESVHASLRRLGVDYLDLYQCHRLDPETPIEETALAMTDLIRQGKVLYWGVSQWPAFAIVQATAFCRAHALPPPISNQPLYNLFDRGLEAEIMPVAAQCGLGQIVFSPLAQGALTGKYASDRTPDPSSRAGNAKVNQFIGRYLTPERLAQAQRLVELAQRHGLRPAPVALAWCLRRPEVASVIVGATNEAQLRDNVGAADLTLPADLVADLEQAFPA
ncbi:MAG: aldo/keto reductase family protein [Planctomycetota bacterium]